MQILMWMLIIIKFRSIIPAKLIGIFVFNQFRYYDFQVKLSVSWLTEQLHFTVCLSLGLLLNGAESHFYLRRSMQVYMSILSFLPSFLSSFLPGNKRLFHAFWGQKGTGTWVIEATEFIWGKHFIEKHFINYISMHPMLIAYISLPCLPQVLLGHCPLVS